MKNHLTPLLVLMAVHPLFAQNGGDNRSDFQLQIRQTTEVIQIDGDPGEPSWQTAEATDTFWLNAPRDEVKASRMTQVKMLYDDKNLYISAVLYGETDFVIQTLKRDADFESSDAFGVIIDPVGQKSVGYAFGVNVGGAQADALVSAAQGVFVESTDGSWDARWYAAVRQRADGWSLEMAIPFKSLRFKAGQTTWGINFWRVDRQHNESHVWAKVPVQFDPLDLGFTGTLVWEQAPDRVGGNVSLTPYALTSFTKDYTRKTDDTDFDFGGEAKVGLTPTLNLDLTVNPDFSHVEVDQQVTNLSRFNIFFPERRQFFLENADIYTNFAAFPDAPFFSRRIGLDPAGQKVPILYGARVSGNVDQNWRMGVLNMHTMGDSLRPAQNYSAAAIHRRVLKRSTVRALLLNRQAFHEGDLISDDYGRNASLEFEYLSDDGRWRGKASYNQSFKFRDSGDGRFLIGSFGYNGRLFQTNWEYQRMGDGFTADMGFISRLYHYDPDNNRLVPEGYSSIANLTDYTIYPKNKKIVEHWFGMENYGWWVRGGLLNEWYTRLRYFMFFKNTSQLRFRFNNNYVHLLYPFYLTEGAPLPATAYNFSEFNIQLNTDLRKKVNLEFFGVYGSFYNGKKATVSASLNYRAQPWGNVALSFEYNDIRLPEPYGNAQFWLINPRVEINFSEKIFWTTFFQYNTQANNFNINSRLQWRYRPMSDLFLVYTDNYQTEGMFGPKNRAVVLKLNYFIQM